MDRWTYACLAMGLLLLAAPAGALIPDDITLTSDTPWLTAGSGETATITVNVTNSNDPVSGAAVDLEVDSAYGSISRTHVVTGDDGTATAVFKPGTRSGTATITATVSHEELDKPLTDSVEQQIDHEKPYRIANILYEPEVTAGETTEIVVQVADRYGNLVDGRRESAEGSDPEEVFFMVGSPTENATFIGATKPDEIEMPVNTAGDAIATLRVDTVAGENLVWIRPPAPIGFSGSRSISITGLGGLPADITQAVDPDSGSVPADGDKVIELTYTLLDKYGNRAPGQGLWVNASIQRGDRPAERQDVLLYSNRYGQVAVTFGPEDSVGIATLTAKATANTSVSVSQTVVFTSTDPVNMLLTASPQSMPSRDINDESVSQVRAKVMDIKGNPVKGQNVMFTLDTDSINSGTYTATGEPYLEFEGRSEVKAVTDDDGYATVRFYPGMFAGLKEDGWSATAKGTATVRATWGSVSRDITLAWMNYPYLSVETEVSPETVAVNDTVDVTIRLKGDGYKLEPDPIDAVLVIDRSLSMMYNIASDSGSNNERMEAAKDAATMFVGQMNSTRDRVGLVSFAKTTTVKGLSNSFNEVNGSLNALNPQETATNIRLGIYKAILLQQNPERPNAIKAVVIMTDGNWNDDGSPIGHGTGYPENASWVYPFPYDNSENSENYRYYDGLGGTLLGGTKDRWWDPDCEYMYCIDGETTSQNMSVFASENGVKLYTITFASNLKNWVNTSMGILATSTGGFYEHAPTDEKLKDIYKRIAGELKTEAGVDTKMDIAFENVSVTGVELPGAEVFDYVYDLGNSTYICNQTGFETTINQTSQWNSGQKLHFEIGTIRLNQVWETTFRLKVLTDGNINVFGSGSTITFNDGADSLELPDTFITAIPDLNNTGITNRWLEVDLADLGSDAFTDTVPLTWTVTYNGTKNIDKALAYSNDNGLSWTVFWAKTVDSSTTEGETLMDVSNLPAGEYLIRLVASAEDAPEARDTTDAPINIGDISRAYIKIE